jgi:tyrosyl-tRNA synthetase
MCTDVPVHEIARLSAVLKAGENPRNLKMRLASEIVTLYHGTSQAEKAEKEFIQIFQQRGKPTEIQETILPKKSYGICELLFDAGLAKSKSDARRLVEGGGVKVDDEKIADPKITFDLGKKPLLIQVGKRHFIKLKSKMGVISPKE